MIFESEWFIKGMCFLMTIMLLWGLGLFIYFLINYDTLKSETGDRK